MTTLATLQGQHAHACSRWPVQIQHHQRCCLWLNAPCRASAVCSTRGKLHQQQLRMQPACAPPSTAASARCRCHASGGSIGSSKATVVEYLLLLQAKPDADPEQVHAMVDSLWSLQYSHPGIICAAAGPVASVVCYKDGTAQPASGAFTHCVHLRLAARQALEQFMSSPVHARALADTVQPLCSDMAQVVFEGAVAKQLEAIYWRGEGYATGLEHLLFLLPGTADLQAAPDLLARLGSLAESSVAGAVQASYGVTLSCTHARLTCTHVFMTRFGSAAQVGQFMATPPCQALAAGAVQLPLHAMASLSWQIDPTDQTRVQSAGGGSVF